MSARRRHASEQPPKAALSESLCAHWLGMTQNFFDSLRGGLRSPLQPYTERVERTLYTQERRPVQLL